MWILFAMARVLVNGGRGGYGSAMTNGKGRTALVTGRHRRRRARGGDGAGQGRLARAGAWPRRQARRGAGAGDRAGRRQCHLPAGRPGVAGRGAPPGGRGAQRHGPARPLDQQRRHRHGRACGGPPDQRRRPRAALCGELSRGLPVDLRAAAAAEGRRAGAHRQRLVGRPAGDRLLRRHADQAATAASPPTARASWRRSCSPSISPRNFQARA